MPKANQNDQGLDKGRSSDPLSTRVEWKVMASSPSEQVLSRQGHLGASSSVGQVSRLLLACHTDDGISRGNLTWRKWELADLPPWYCTTDGNALHNEATQVSGTL